MVSHIATNLCYQAGKLPVAIISFRTNRGVVQMSGQMHEKWCQLHPGRSFPTDDAGVSAALMELRANSPKLPRTSHCMLDALTEGKME